MSETNVEKTFKIIAYLSGGIAMLTTGYVLFTIVKGQKEMSTALTEASKATPTPAIVVEATPVPTATPVAVRTPTPTPRPAVVATNVPHPVVTPNNSSTVVIMPTPFGVKKRNFRYANPTAKEVLLTGNFNQWKPEPMIVDKAGVWWLEKTLPRGVNIEYQLIVDGAKIADPWGAIPQQSNGDGTMKSVYIIPEVDPTPRPKPPETPTPATAGSSLPAAPAAPVLMATPIAGGAPAAPALATPEALDMNTLAATPADWPKIVTLKTGAVFPVIINGKAAGEIKVPAGTQVTVIKVTADQLTVSFQGSTGFVPARSTDVLERAIAAKKH